MNKAKLMLLKKTCRECKFSALIYNARCYYSEGTFKSENPQYIPKEKICEFFEEKNLAVDDAVV